MVDSNATANTKNLFKQLYIVSGGYIYFGQSMFYTRTTSGNGNIGTYPVDCYEITGKYPAILCLDYQWDKSNIAYHHNLGGKIILSWGMYNPVNIVVGTDGHDYACVKEHTSSTNDKPITGENCYSYWARTYTDGFGDVWQDAHLYDQHDHPIQKILTGGSRNGYYHALLDTMAAWFGTLLDSEANLIPIIFRPFHEMDGSWFWWGDWTTGGTGNTKEEYIQLFQETVEYLRDVKSVHNILYCFSTDKLTGHEFTDFYPGDDYVDIISSDLYKDSLSENEYVTKVANIAREGINRGKPSGITEFSKYASVGINGDNDFWVSEFLTPILANSEAKKISFVCCFENNSTYNFGPGWKKPDEDNFRTFSDNHKIWMLGDEIIYSKKICNAEIKNI